MGLFGQSTPFDADIEKSTSETFTNENWSLILDVCDKVTSNPRSAKDCLKAIMRRMGHTDPHVVMQAITLLDACVSNCGKQFHLEIASREFENEFRRLLSKAQPKVSARMRQVLKSWAEGDFKSDPELNLIPFLYQKLRSEGYEFNNLSDKPKAASRAAISKDPNVVSSQEEEDDIAKAIELSLKETKSSPKQQTVTTTANTTYPSLYPSVTGGSVGPAANATTPPTAAPAVEPRKVRALYDFEAAEDNELTFYAGEVIHVIDDSDPNWWKGSNQRGEGLFPSNFVTADLSVDPERLDLNLGKSKENIEPEQAAQNVETVVSNQRIEVDEPKVDRLLHLLHEANPEDPSQDTEEMLRLEPEVHQMGPLIDSELERVDRKHAQLTQLSSDLVDAINMYHSLMRDDRAAMLGANNPYMPGMHPGMSPGMPAQMLYGPYGAGTNMPAPMNSLPQMSMYPPNMQVPMQYQNGHATNGGLPQMMYAAQPQLPQHQQAMYAAATTGQQQQPPPTPPVQQQQQQHMPVYAQPQQQQQQQFMPTHAQQHITADLQQQQQQQPQQFISSPPTQQQQQALHLPTQTIAGYMPQAASAPLPQQQQQQQPQQQQAYMMSNGTPQAFMAVQPPPQVMPTNGALNAEQFSQLQQQMAAMSMNMGNNQPVTQNFLVQNEPKNNIPIYQQQR